MNNYINDFTNHLRDAIKIASKTKFKKSEKEFKNVLIIGLGGSGIGGTILNDITTAEVGVPIISTKDYSIPNFVNKDTLVIASSYSGNTEETISAVKKCSKRECEIAIITSGGGLVDVAVKKNYNYIKIPGGHPPRAMFGYAFTQLFCLLNKYEIINNDYQKEFLKSIDLLDTEKGFIQENALKLAKKIYGNTPVIYAVNGFEGVAVRFRQQLNENSKMLCWHHVIPEMNHNELLGWRTNTQKLAVIFFRNECDYKKNKIRIDITKKVISKYTKNITEVWSKGDSLIQNTLYHIHFGDWVSWYLSERNSVDAIEINVINFLKSELAKV